MKGGRRGGVIVFFGRGGGIRVAELDCDLGRPAAL